MALGPCIYLEFSFPFDMEYVTQIPIFHFYRRWKTEHGCSFRMQMRIIVRYKDCSRRPLRMQFDAGMMLTESKRRLSVDIGKR